MLAAFRAGVFPMAVSRRADHVFWVDPEDRGVLPLDRFHVPRSLARAIRRGRFEVACDLDFGATIRACATSRTDRSEETWINRAIERLFVELARRGHAHSVEVRSDGRLVGGLYGCAVGAAFFGESMFSIETDASKVALVHLVARLRLGGFRLLDTQDLTAHLSRFGGVSIPRAEYHRRLAAAVAGHADWIGTPAPAALEAEFAAMSAPGANPSAAL